MAQCKNPDDAFVLASNEADPMNVVAVIQHTAGEYLGLIEDHLEGRRIRFQYYRPFAAGTLPAAELPADAMILLGGGPWGAAGSRDLPTLEQEVALTRTRLDEGTPVIGDPDVWSRSISSKAGQSRSLIRTKPSRSWLWATWKTRASASSRISSTSRSPASIWSPGSASTSATTPSRGATSACSIFIASRTARR